MDYIIRPEQRVEARSYDVVVVGGGTAGVFAAISAARTGAKTALIESKGYVGGIATEGGTGLHSFYNLWKAFPGVEKRKVVRGLPEEFIDRLTAMGGCSGHNETLLYYEYDSDTLCIDVEDYKFLALQMLRDAGVDVLLNTFACDALVTGDQITGVITESHQGTEAVLGKVFIDATGYGDLSVRAGADYTAPVDYNVANSMGIAGIDIDKYYAYFEENGALQEYARGPRGGRPNQIIRVAGNLGAISPELGAQAEAIGMNTVTTSLHDNFLMFIKLNFKIPATPTNRDVMAQAEYELRRRQQEGIKLLRQAVPGAENAFIARTSPSASIRRARCIACDHDLSLDEIVNCTHFADDVYSYGFHDSAPRIQIKNGGTYGFPYRAMVARKLANLFAVGMLVTSDRAAHMSTRNTVSCMAMGQAAGTAAALCIESGIGGIRDLPYKTLYSALKRDGVWFDAEA